MLLSISLVIIFTSLACNSLRVTFFKTKSTAMAGETIPVVLTIKNTGNATYSNYTMKFYLSYDRTYSNDDIELVDFPETRIAVFQHKGDPKGIPNSVRKFISWRKENGLPPSRSATFNILHTNPNEVALSEHRFDICAEIKSAVKANAEGIVEETIPSGMCAKLRYVGSYDHLEEAVSYLYGVWLPQSTMEPRDFPLFLQRVKFFPECSEHEAITDIFLPLS